MARSKPSLAPACRAGFAYRGLILAMVVLLVVPAIGWSVMRNWRWSSQNTGDVMMYTVERKEFIHDVTERGNVESASNVEIASKVRSGGSSYSGTAILWIIEEGKEIKPEDCLPEGTVVTFEVLREFEELQGETPATADAEPALPEPAPEKAAPKSSDGGSHGADGSINDAGDGTPGKNANGPRNGRPAERPATVEELQKALRLVTLDSSSLENQRIQQEIIFENSLAAETQAENSLQTAKITKDEYLEGTYVETMLDFKIKISEAEVNLKQKKEYLKFSRTLERKGYITKQQLETDETNVTKAENELKLLVTQLDVYERLTKTKMLGGLDADITSAEAKLKAERASHKLDEEKLRDIAEQVANCTIFATKPGQVVYANSEGQRGHGEVVIQEGTMIRERQVIIKLPDPKQMQVQAKISEGKISMVDEGMSATIKLDAFPDKELTGVVKEVSEYPAGSGWFGSAVKEYETLIEILNPPSDLRPGLTAEVKIRVEQLDDVLQVPVQAIIEHGNKLYCVLYDGKKFEKRRVKIGANNDKFVVITKGLQKDDRIVRNAVKYREEVGLTEVTSEEEAQGTEDRTDDGSQTGPPQDRDESGGDGGKSGPDGGKPRGDGKPAKSGRPNPAEQFKKMDKNGDGLLQAHELPAMMRQNLTKIDSDGDGAVSRAELSAAMAKGRPSGGSRGPEPRTQP